MLLEKMDNSAVRKFCSVSLIEPTKLKNLYVIYYICRAKFFRKTTIILFTIIFEWNRIWKENLFFSYPQDKKKTGEQSEKSILKFLGLDFGFQKVSDLDWLDFLDLPKKIQTQEF